MKGGQEVFAYLYIRVWSKLTNTIVKNFQVNICKYICVCLLSTCLQHQQWQSFMTKMGKSLSLFCCPYNKVPIKFRSTIFGS